MRNFLLRLLCFAVTMAAVCTFAGFSIDRLKGVARGATARELYINDSLKADIIVLGSSRALHHYDPVIMESILKRSTYNCGEDKMGIIFNYGRFRIATRKRMPEVVVYDVEPDYDLLFDDKTSYISGLRPYTKYAFIRQLLVDVDPMERFKMLLVPYRYNNKLQQVAKDCVAPETYSNGYIPYVGEMTHCVAQDYPQDHYDTLKWKYIEQLADDCKGKATLIFTISPQLSFHSDSVYAPLKRLCKERNIALLNHFCDTTFTNNWKLFYNSNHLEKKGAELYSRTIAREIKNILNNGKHYNTKDESRRR